MSKKIHHSTTYNVTEESVYEDVDYVTCELRRKEERREASLSHLIIMILIIFTPGAVLPLCLSN